MAQFRKDKRVSADWLKNPSYSSQRMPPQPKTPQIVSETAVVKKDVNLSSMRSNNYSIEDLTQILRNPYQLNTEEPFKRGKLYPTSNAVNAQQAKTPLKAVKGSLSVPFGSRSRRPLGDTTLKEITEYSYIPDVRRLNALSTVYLKEQRSSVFQKAAAKYKQVMTKTPPKESTNQSQRMLMSQASQQKLVRRSQLKRKKLNYGNDGESSAEAPQDGYYNNDGNQAGRMPRLRPQDMDVEQRMNMMNRSKSTVAQIGAKLYEDNPQPRQIHQLHQVESAAELQRHLNMETKNTQHEASYEEDLGLTSIPKNSHMIGPSSTQAGSSLIPGGGAVTKTMKTHHQTYSDAAINKAYTNGSNGTLSYSVLPSNHPDDQNPIQILVQDSSAPHLVLANFIPPNHDIATHQRNSYDSKDNESPQVGNDQIIILPTIYKEGSFYSSQKIDVDDGSDRLLLNQNSVQQFSKPTLQLESQRMLTQGGLQKMKVKQKEKSGRQRKTHTSLTKNKSSFTITDDQNLIQNNTFSGAVQTRKLAPQDTVQMKLQKAVIQQNVQRQRQLNFDQTKQTALNELAGEFLAQINGVDPILKTPQGGEQRRESSLPHIPNISNNSFSSASFLPQDLNREFSQSSKLMLSKRRLQNQHRETRHQQRELVKVLKAQNLHNSDGLNTKAIYATASQGISGDQFSRSIPVRGDSTLDRGKLRQNSRVEIQQEFTNEKSYVKVSKTIKQPNLGTNRSAERLNLDYQTIQSTTKTQSSENILLKTPNSKTTTAAEKSAVNEIIPRMAYFPLQGKTIQVAGHDESQIFSSRKKKNSSQSQSYAEKINSVEEKTSSALKQKQKIASQWKALHKKDTSPLRPAETLEILDKDPLKKQLMDIQNQPGVRKHYLDDEIRGRKYMKDVGPASYETLDKQVIMPVHLRPNVAPALIYKDMVKNSRRRDSTDTVPLKQNNNIADEEIKMKTDLIMKILKPQENNAYADKDSAQDKSPVTHKDSMYLQDEDLSRDNKADELRSTSVRDSVEFNANAAYHQIILPAIPKEFIDQNGQTDIKVTENDSQPITARKENLTGHSFQNSKSQIVKVPLKAPKSRMTNQYQSHSQQTAVDNGNQQARKRGSLRSGGSKNSDIDAVLNQAVQKFQDSVLGTKATANQLQGPQIYSSSNANQNITKESIISKNHKGIVQSHLSRHQKGVNQYQNSSGSLIQTEKMPEMVSYKIDGPIYNSSSQKNQQTSSNANQKRDGSFTSSIRGGGAPGPNNNNDISSLIQLMNGKNPEQTQQPNQNTSPMNNQMIGKFASAKVSERSNETLRKSPNKTITYETSVGGSHINVQQNQYQSLQRHMQNLSPTYINATTQSIDSNEQKISHPIYTYQVVTEEQDRTNETDPPLEIDPNSQEGMGLILAINQHQKEGSNATRSSLKQMMQQVQDSKKERELKKQIGKSNQHKQTGAVIDRTARFKYFDTEQVLNQSLPGPGSYNTVNVKDIQVVRTSPVKPTQAVAKQQDLSLLPQEQLAQLAPETEQLHMRDASQEKSAQMLVEVEAIIITKGVKGYKVSSRERIKQTVERPSANFQSKVPKETFKNEQNFTGEVDFNDATNLTISKAQNQLTLRTVQKMFAGRKEQHTLNVHKLVRINRLKQLNKADPLINFAPPQEEFYLNEAGEVVQPTGIMDNNSLTVSQARQEIMWMPESDNQIHQNNASINLNLDSFSEQQIVQKSGQTTETIPGVTQNQSYGFIILDQVNEMAIGGSRENLSSESVELLNQNLEPNGGIIDLQTNTSQTVESQYKKSYNGEDIQTDQSNMQIHSRYNNDEEKQQNGIQMSQLINQQHSAINPPQTANRDLSSMLVDSGPQYGRHSSTQQQNVAAAYQV